MNKRHVLLIFSFLTAVSACTPKNTPRYEHEGPKQWTPVKGPSDETVEASAMNQADLSAMYARLNQPGENLTASVLQPLSRFVLNAAITQRPANRTTRLTEMISVFNAAFLAQLQKGDKSAEFLKIKEDYYNTVFSGCSRDLKRDCATADIFSAQPRHTKIFTYLASELDVQIEARLKAANGSSLACVQNDNICRQLVDERYRRLAMASYNKRAHYDEKDFQFAYLKYARLFALFVQDSRACRGGESQEQCGQRLKLSGERAPEYSSMSFSYLAETHSHIFQTIISKYDPEKYDSAEFKAFVENFNPWTYSKKQADMFQNGASRMFEFGTKCCLYTDSQRRSLSPSVTKAIQDAMGGKDHFVPTDGLSFAAIVKDVKDFAHKNKADAKDPSQYDLFRKLGILDLVRKIENPNSGFYNEYFFIVDRLFRGHLGSAEVDRVLRNTNPERAKRELPVMVTDYMKIYLVYMVVKTNRFMAKMYAENLSSEKIFEEAVNRSRELTGHWHEVQAKIELLKLLMGSYFNGMGLRADPGFLQADKEIKAVNRNIHYLSVFPNMIVMTYFLSKVNGSITFTSWWGQKFEKQGPTVLKDLFAGNERSAWFQFGVDSEGVDRLMLLYSLEYLLSTQALDSFVATDEKTGEQSQTPVKDRSKFFDTIFSKYLDDGLTELREKITSYERSTLGNSNMSFTDELCRYELSQAGGIAPRVEINFMDLGKYTYSGYNDNSVNGVLNNYLGNSADSLGLIRREIDSRRVYMKAMIKVIQAELVRTGQVAFDRQNPEMTGASHPDLRVAFATIQQIDDLQAQLARIFLAKHRTLFRCISTLQEIERRRANRLYDEERAHLSQVFDKMKALYDVSEGPALDAKVEEINNANFTPDKGYRFSHVSGRSFLLSKYDLLMRIKRNMETDVFQNMTAREIKTYGNLYATYARPRSVRVLVPDAVERDEMVTKALSVPIYMRGTTEADREDFIRQGIALMNGKPGSFVFWQNERAGDKGLEKYLMALQEFYLMGPVVADGKQLMVTKEELVDAYIRITASYSMDAIDVQNAADFGVDGRYPKTFFLGRLFQKDGRARWPLFYSLMDDMNNMAVANLKAAGPIRESLEFAKTFNSLQAFVFTPSPAVEEGVRRLYGDRTNGLLARLTDLFSYLEELEKKTASIDELDPRLKNAYVVENGFAYTWYDASKLNLVDRQRAADNLILRSDFIQQSGNFFGTREKVKVP